MGNVGSSSPEDGGPTERQRLLSSSLERDSSSTAPPVAHQSARNEQDLTASSMKLGASALNFFLSGIALVAVGVCL